MADGAEAWRDPSAWSLGARDGEWALVPLRNRQEGEPIPVLPGRGSVPGFVSRATCSKRAQRVGTGHRDRGRLVRSHARTVFAEISVASWQLTQYHRVMAHLLDAIRDAIRKSEQSPAEIARGSGVAKSQLSRLLSGERGLSVEVAEHLAQYLNLEIIIRPRRRSKGR